VDSYFEFRALGGICQPFLPEQRTITGKFFPNAFNRTATGDVAETARSTLLPATVALKLGSWTRSGRIPIMFLAYCVMLNSSDLESVLNLRRSTAKAWGNRH
jgi:hypothetical protein